MSIPVHLQHLAILNYINGLNNDNNNNNNKVLWTMTKALKNFYQQLDRCNYFVVF